MAADLTSSAERAGRVLDAAGRPVPYAGVVVVTGSVPVPEIALLSDDEGRFALRLPPGIFTLRAHGPGGTGEARVEAGVVEDEIVITIADQSAPGDGS